jgi:hypothetical protein
LVGHDSQEDIEQSFRMMQTFQEALSDEAMFDPSETAVTLADAIWAEDRDVGSHGEEGKGGGAGNPSRFVSLTQEWQRLIHVGIVA